MKLIRVIKKQKRKDADEDIEKQIVDILEKAESQVVQAAENVKKAGPLTKKLSYDYRKSKKIMNALWEWHGCRDLFKDQREIGK